MVGVVMVLIQFMIGGVTRITDSGLSITEWQPILGVVPPIGDVEWQEAFTKYQDAAKKQFESLHADMQLSEFKFIYFWEYFHRLWARTIGIVFLIPFLFFLFKKWIPKWLLKNLGIVIFLASLEAVFGFIMVASGLNDDSRTWVSAYKLVGHLTIGTVLLAYLYWTWLKTSQPMSTDNQFFHLRKSTWAILGVLFLQIAFGGLMAGMRAGLLHPHFPWFVEGGRLIHALSATAEANVIDYESSSFIKAIVQILHRATAYILTIMIVAFYFKSKKLALSFKLKRANQLLIIMLIIQFLLGVFTVINCVGSIPLIYGVLHQLGAMLLLMIILFIHYQLIPGKRTQNSA